MPRASELSKELHVKAEQLDEARFNPGEEKDSFDAFSQKSLAGKYERGQARKAGQLQGLTAFSSLFIVK